MNIMHGTALSRIIAVGLLVLVLAMIYLLLVVPVHNHYLSNEQEIEHYSSQIANYKAIANSRTKIEQLLKTIRPQDNALGYYLKGSTQALASAELQAYVRSIIESSKGNLVSTQPIVKGEREPERTVRVSVRMTGTIDSLQQVLYRIATGVPVLLTDEVMIRRGKSSQSRTDKQEDEGTLDVQFTITGFVKESVS